MTALRHSLPLGFGLCFFVASLFGQHNVQATEHTDAIVRRMANVDHFAFGGIGFASLVSEGEKDYKLISGSPNAEANFEQLFTVGNPQAKCYALVGLHKLNPEKFKALSSPLHESKTPVLIARGCIISHQTLSTVIEAIQGGAYRNQ